MDILDPAIMRPGRFDRKIVVGRPDVAGREEILQVHAKNKPLGDDVDLKQIAQTTAGFTGADLENLLNGRSPLFLQAKRKPSGHIFQQADIQKCIHQSGESVRRNTASAISEKKRKLQHIMKFRTCPSVSSSGRMWRFGAYGHPLSQPGAGVFGLHHCRFRRRYVGCLTPGERMLCRRSW